MDTLETREANPSLTPFDLLQHRQQLFERLRTGENLQEILRGAALTGLAGSALFGLALGTFAADPKQLLASMVKVPLLLLGTAALCFPTFHILQSWRAPKPLTLQQAAALMALSLAAVALVWGSLAPPVVFLVGSTLHYHLVQFLALMVGALGGVVGLSVLRAGYRTLSAEQDTPCRPALFLVLYCGIFAAIGGQLAWVLRPIVASPNLPFQLFRPIDPHTGSIFQFIWRFVFGA
jgi:hypothetical protein